MATVTWKGGATAVAQVDSGTIDTFDASSTYTVTIGGYAVSQAGTTDVATTATNLVAALNASTHPYFAAITWSNPSGGTVRGTGDIAGVPFVAALTVAGGTGTVTNFSTTTACTGPHHADDAENWSSGALPAASDTVVIAAGPSLLYGLDALTSTALARLEVRQTFAARVGLEPSRFATSLDGETTTAAVREYRDAYLEISANEIVIGEYLGPVTPVGSSRICIQQTKAGASILDVINTSATTLADRPTVRYLASNSGADVIVRFAPGGVGLAVEQGETTTVGDVYVADASATSSLFLGQGVTLTSFEQVGGDNRLAAAATITTVDVRGGELLIAGYDYLISTLNVHGGEIIDRHENTGGAEWTTVNQYGGTLSLPRVNASTRTYTTLNLYAGRIEADWGALSGTEVLASATGVPERRAIEIAAL